MQSVIGIYLILSFVILAPLAREVREWVEEERGFQGNNLVRGTHSARHEQNKAVMNNGSDEDIHLDSFPIPFPSLNGSESEESMEALEMKETVGNEVKKTCRACESNKQMEKDVSSNELRKMRLEMIKEQILRKLGLKEAPLTDIDVPKETFPLPQLLAMGDILPRKKKPYIESRDRDEDFFGKTEQVVVFPEEMIPKCAAMNLSPFVCVLFNLPKGVRVEEVSTAELWVYKLKDERKREKNDTILAAEILFSDQSKNKLIKIKENVEEGWVPLNISRTLKNWLRGEYFTHILQIACKTCLADSKPFKMTGDHRPFIVINIGGSIQKKRSRRNINCQEGETECCRESFRVTFQEIGWNNWIIEPSGYDAYYCRGSCISINSPTISENRHSQVAQKYIEKRGLNNVTSEIIPCCTAKKTSSISILYRDPNNMNTTVIRETLPSMVIESCGC